MLIIPPISLPLVCGLLLGAALLATLVMSVVFIYHWKRYGMGASAIFFAAVLYFGTAAFFTMASISFYSALR